ncbi:MAG: preprotein translocase subunit YajC [Alphaproteobacteria bacterium CG_4_9_14_3_um_filter_47_13]|nr:MAG: preprotein translocase subunit YajC [Alphaproteobacteria bacterium CG_4_9_14_3_um_filter_47_13]
MLISQAIAQTVAQTGVLAAEAPAPWEAFALNMLLILTLVVMFYVLLIMPQQKRFKRHREMIDQLKKGDEIVTSGGFLGKIDKIKDGDDEVVIDLGNNVKVTALRSAIQNKAKAG